MPRKSANGNGHSAVKVIESASDLTPDPRNANKGTDRGRGLLADSLTKYGAGRSILADRHGAVIAGNKTLSQAVARNMPVKVVQTDGTELVVVQRTDLDLSTDKGAKELAVADNRVAQVDLDWNTDILQSLSSEIDLTQFWQKDELSELLGSSGVGGGDDPGADVDRASELQEKWHTELGQLWAIGRHRLLCGDCTVRENVERVMGGEKGQVTITDPPYNVGIDYGVETDDSKALEAYQTFSLAWFALAVEHTDRQIVTPGCNNLASWLRWFEPYHVAPWTKTNAMTNGKVSRWWCWEPVLFFGEKWPRERSNDVFDYPVPPQKAEGMGSLSPFHPCPKPLPMYVDLIENYTDPGAVVLEPFSGSGTTLVACEQLGRIGRGLEISPAYCAVILERLSGMNLKPELVNA